MRKLQKPSNDFVSFLNVVNQLHDIKLPIREYIDSDEIIFKAIQKQPALFEYIFDKKVGEEVSLTERRKNLFSKYDSFLIDRNLLLILVDELTAEETIIGAASAINFLTRDRYGRLIQTPESFKRFTDLDTKRLRRCPVCSDIFFATRTDKKFCSNCSNIGSQRAFQKNNKDQINAQRRQKYYEAKGIPCCEKCIRPTTKCDCYQIEKRSKEDDTL